MAQLGFRKSIPDRSAGVGALARSAGGSEQDPGALARGAAPAMLSALPKPVKQWAAMQLPMFREHLSSRPTAARSAQSVVAGVWRPAMPLDAAQAAFGAVAVPRRRIAELGLRLRSTRRIHAATIDSRHCIDHLGGEHTSAEQTPCLPSRTTGPNAGESGT